MPGLCTKSLWVAVICITGATERRIGKFELANGGTLFLDEVGEMPIDFQVKLIL